jgi:hypothetical protein
VSSIGAALVAGLGAGLMYFLDPDTGRQRRALLRRKIVHLACATQPFNRFLDAGQGHRAIAQQHMPHTQAASRRHSDPTESESSVGRKGDQRAVADTLLEYGENDQASEVM